MPAHCCPPQTLPSFFDTPKEAQYSNRPGRQIRAGTILLNFKTRKILLIQSYRRFWGFPKGHVENSESVEACAIRETYEETGIQLHEHDLLHSHTVYNGDGVYFVVDATRLAYRTDLIQSTDEITGIGWFCMDCIQEYVTEEVMLINSHLRLLLPVIRRELSRPRSHASTPSPSPISSPLQRSPLRLGT